MNYSNFPYQNFSLFHRYAIHLEWVGFSKSAQLGNPEAHLALAANFILGRGIEKDLTLAHVSCNLATFLSRDIASISRSIQLRTELEAKMAIEQIKRAEQISRKCIEKKFKECMTYALENR